MAAYGAEDLLLEVRRPDLTRADMIPQRDIDGLSLVPRFNAVGAWAIALPADHPQAVQLRQPGWGLIATLDGDVLLSGPTAEPSYKRSSSDSATWTINGFDDNVILADALAWPSPATFNLDAQTGSGGDGYDVRSGPTETVMRALVGANIGPSAVTQRKDPRLQLAPDLGRGSTVQSSARFDQLLTLLQALALAGGNLGFGVRQEDDHLLFYVYEPRDLTAQFRFDVDNGTLDDVGYSYTAPTVTRAIVAGQGEGAARQLLGRTSADSLDAEDLWGRRIERFIDQRQTSDVGELAQAGDEALADGGTTGTGLSITPVDTDSRRFARDYYLGDKVTVVVDDLELAEVITEAPVTYGTDGLVVKASVGDASAALRDPVEKAIRLMREQSLRQAKRLSRLERT